MLVHAQLCQAHWSGLPKMLHCHRQKRLEESALALGQAIFSCLTQPTRKHDQLDRLLHGHVRDMCDSDSSMHMR